MGRLLKVLFLCLFVLNSTWADETWTIKSAAGDYTSLAAAYTAKGDVDYTGKGVVGFECYSGFDMGVVSMGGGSNWDASNYLRIYAAAGEEHDGKTTANDGCYIDVGNGGTGVINTMPYSRLEGIRIQVDAGAEWNSADAIQFSDWSGIVIDGVVVVMADRNNAFYECVTVGSTLAPTDSPVIKNCSIYYLGAGSFESPGIRLDYLSFDAGDTSGTIYLYDNTVYQAEDGFTVGADKSSTGTPTLFVVSTGNVAMGSTGTGDFVDNSAGGGVLDMTQTYCCSGDITADDWTGAGNLISKTAINQWVSVGSDHMVKDTDADIYAAGVDIGSVTVDILGTSRKDPPDIGAYEIAGAGGTTKKRAVSAFSGFIGR